MAYKRIPTGPIIKWYETKLTYKDKYRFGLLSYQEYCDWAAKNFDENASGYPDDEDTSTKEDTQKPNDGKTFWANDEEERTNLSHDDYEDFLSNNSIDTSNKSSVDVGSLMAKYGDEKESTPAPEETDIDAVLKQVSQDIHGGNILSEEEIHALFDTANGR